MITAQLLMASSSVGLAVLSFTHGAIAWMYACLFIGGVARNEGVRNALRELFKLQDGDFVVPELSRLRLAFTENGITPTPLLTLIIF